MTTVWSQTSTDDIDFNQSIKGFAESSARLAALANHSTEDTSSEALQPPPTENLQEVSKLTTTDDATTQQTLESSSPSTLTSVAQSTKQTAIFQHPLIFQ